MSFLGRSIVSINDFSKSDLLHILKTAKKFQSSPPSKLLNGLVLGCLFFEPSTRTRLSFESAMQKMGGSVIGFDSEGATSTKKGETLADTIRMVEQYADVLVIRHYWDGAARLAYEVAQIPVINAGDGANQHPTQTCLDLFTIAKTQGKKFNNSKNPLDVGFIGDLKYGRTVHSLAHALSHFNVTLSFIAPDPLQMPESYIQDLRKQKIKVRLTDKLAPVVKKLDILYCTRIQEERFPDPLEFRRVKSLYQINLDSLKGVRPNFKIMHPLPRVDEVHSSVDASPYAAYFEQAKVGIPVRQALLGLVLGKLK